MLPSIHPRLRRQALGAIAVLGVGWLFFAGVADHGFTYDDEDYLRNAERARDDLLLLFRAQEDEPWLSRIGLNLYFFAAQTLFGHDAGYYHLASAGLHLLNVALVIWFVQAHGRSRPTAVAAGMLFMVNGMHYRAVYWISAASLLLGVAFVLVALILTRRYIDHQRRTVLSAAVCSFMLGALCHQAMAVAACFPALLGRAHGLPGRRQLLLLAAFLLPALVILLVERLLHGGAFTSQPTFHPVGWHVVTNLFTYCCGLLVASHLDPRYLSLSAAVAQWVGGLTVVLLLALSRRRALRFWVAWTLLAAVPFAMWLRPEVLSRYFYLPAIGSSVILAAGIDWLAARARRRSEVLARCVYGFVLFAVVASSSLAIDRRHSVQYYDEGKYELFEKDNPGLAAERLETALRLDPQAPAKVYLWLARAHYQLRDFGAAEEAVLRLLDRRPSHAQARDLLRRVRREAAVDGQLRAPSPSH